MMDLALLSCFVMFVSVGFLSPFVWTLGYVWVDSMLPQALSYGLLNSVPIAFIMGAGAVFSYMLQDRRDRPPIFLVQVLCVLMAAWMTATCYWAVAPNMAWLKWDPSFKTVAFSVFMPFVFRSRIQIEALMLVLLASTAPHLLPWGFKTFLTGGGYEMSLGLLGSNTATIAESSAIAAFAVALIPILVWTRQHSLILPWRKPRALMTSALVVMYLVATIGTFARTGLIAIGVMASGMLLRSRRKFIFILLAFLMGTVVFFVTSDKWTSRVSSIGDYEQENSAYSRLLVWEWTWNFAKTHPFGGGFNAYVINVLTGKEGEDGKPEVQFGRAFHNIYVAALGEHGYPGVALYVTILILTLFSMQRTARLTRGKADLQWAGDLAKAGQLSLLVLMASGCFIDISYTFMIWDLVVLAMCLKAHVARALAPGLIDAAAQGASLAGKPMVGGPVPAAGLATVGRLQRLPEPRPRAYPQAR